MNGGNRMTERCCVCDEQGEDQCPNEATWYAWDAREPWHGSFFCYCAEHLLSDGIDDTHVTKVMPIQDNKGRSANG